MLTEKDHYLFQRNKCLLRAVHAHGNEAASIWREIAESYRLLEEHQDREDEQTKRGALLAGVAPPRLNFEIA